MQKLDIWDATYRIPVQTSKLSPIETFIFLEHDGLLQFHQDITQHYQDVLKVSYSPHPHFTHPQHRVKLSKTPWKIMEQYIM